MTVRHLKIFVTVYQTGNITRAAKLLYMTQPSVSRAIQELETHYGVKLFERINRRLSVTESGKQLYAQALHIVDSFDMMEKGLRNWDEFGVLRIGATITIGTVFMPQAVARFQASHENLRVEVKVSNGAQLRQALLDNTIDLALIEGGFSDKNLVMKPFAQDRLVLILSPGDPLLQRKSLTLSDLKNCRFLLRENGSVGRSFLNHVFAARGFALTPLWESASTRAIIHAVSMGLGVSILPEQLVAAEIASGVIAMMPVSDEPFGRSNYIVWHKNKFLTQSAKAFISLCDAT